MKLVAPFFLFCLCITLSAMPRAIVIEDFDDGEVELSSWADEDLDPDDWTLDTLNTYAGSAYALKLYGNTWKQCAVAPVTLQDGDVWQVACWVDNLGSIHGFGLGDSTNVLFYALDGSDELNPEVWVTAGQGYFPEDQWVLHGMPVAEDFLARFDYLPVIDRIVFVNDGDSNSGVCLFDLVQDVTEDLPVAPLVTVSYDIAEPARSADGSRTVEVQFHSTVDDPDSDSLSYAWSFGDGATGTLADPLHVYDITDDHEYSVLLAVLDDTGLRGYASCHVQVDEGNTSLPLSINFTGDIMLARYYETPGGIIPTQGVEAVFAPTRDMLADADLTVANLECCFTTATQHHPTKSIYYKGNPTNVSGLVFAGIDVVSMANNHTMDYLYPGLAETQAVLDSAGVVYGGAGADSYEAYRPVIWNAKGLNVAMLFASDRTGQYNNAQPYLNAGYDSPGFAMLTPWYTLQQMEEVDAASDFQVLNWHCGSEYSTSPGSNYDFIPPPDMVDPHGDEDYDPLIDVPQMWDRQLRQFAIDNGADAVICHHPHIIQGVEVYEGKLIAHSLGNYAFDLYYPETMPSMILRGELTADGFKRWTIRPVFIDDYIPRPATGGLGLHILDYIARRSQELDTTVRVHRDSLYADVILDPNFIVPQQTVVDTMISLEQRDDMYVSAPVALARRGDISSMHLTTAGGTWEARLGRDLVWWGNMENEGSSMWNLNSNYEDYNTDTCHTGQRCIKHQNWTGGDGVTTNLVDRIKCGSDSAGYTVQAWVKTDTAQSATVNVRFYTTRTDNAYLDEQNLGELNGTNDWTFLWNDLTLPDGSAYFDVRMLSMFSESEPGPAWYDDVNLVEWTDWAPVNELDEIAHPNDWYWLQVRTADEQEQVLLSYEETTWTDYVERVHGGTASVMGASLHRNWPNPFNPRTTFAFSMAQPGRATLKVYNVRGQLVRTVADGRFGAGEHEVQWNGDDNTGRTVASGVYLYRLQVGGRTVGTRKCLLLK